MNVLSGLLRPDEGTIEIFGDDSPVRSPRAAIDRGIGMVHQHFRLVDRFTVAENVTLGWHAPKAILRPGPLEREIARLSETYGMPVQADRPVWHLSVGEQQRVEILKNLYRGARVLILDEPTAVLTPQESLGLFESLRRMAEEGRGIVFISHKLDEVMAVADRITVLRRGRNVATVAKAKTTQGELARMMIGHDLPQAAAPGDREPGPPVLRLEAVEAADDRGLPALGGVELEVRAGEILGLAGVAGNGQLALAEVVVGLRSLSGGRVLFEGQDVSRWSIPRRIAAGIGYCPENRLRQGVAPALSIAENLIAKSYRSAPVAGRFFLNRRGARRAAEELAKRFDIRGADLDAPVATLSGGNVQKVVLAREISADPHLLIAAQPTRGLDVGAVAAVYGHIRTACLRGIAILLISSELDELLTVADRIVVLYRGRIMGSCAADPAQRETIGAMMAGNAQ